MLPADEQCPKIREVDFFPIKNRDGTFVALRDPLEFSTQVLAFRPALMPIIALMDGRHTLNQIAKQVEKENKTKISIEQLKLVVDKLDDALLLANDRFEAHCKRIIGDYLEAKVRPAAHAGVSYPTDPEEIHAYFSEHFLTGPGFPKLEGRAAPPRAVISPHIDLRVGGMGFASAYKAIAESDPIDLFVILGTAHFPTRFPYSATWKDFETPLGIAETDREFLERLRKGLPFDLFSDEFAHRSEHSIEFQVVYLQSTLPITPRPVKIVPILCGSFAEMVKSGKEPAKHPMVGAFIDALKRELAAEKRNVCIISGVDLAHVGGRFGDEDMTLTPTRRKIFEETDRSMLEIILKGSATKFFEFIVEEENKRRICGFPAIYTMLKFLPLKKGELLHYDQSYEKATNSLVTFCSAKFQ
jgi:AmmeMemoRadiSam system protein B